MMTVEALNVDVAYQRTTHTFFIWGEARHRNVSKRLSYHPSNLAHVLLAWDKNTFYGTMVETQEWNGKHGLSMSALQALDYFAHEYDNDAIPITWSNECKDLRQVARIVHQAISECRFTPDFEQWRMGIVGWKLQIDNGSDLKVLQSVPYLQDWLNEAMNEHIAKTPSVQATWAALQAQFPLLTAESRGEWDDESDWLIGIGLKADETPFRIGFRLIEPLHDEDSWLLEVVLQDRQDESRLISVHAPNADADIPDDWQAHLERITIALQRVGRGLPWFGDLARDERQSWLLDDTDAWFFLTEGSLRMMDAGYAVYLPDWWAEVSRMKSRVKAKVKSSVGSAKQSMFGIAQTVDFDWRIAIGDVDLSEQAFRELLETKQRLIRYNGQWIQIDQTFFQEALRTMKQIDKQGGLSFREVLEMHLLGGSEDDAGGRSKNAGAGFVDESAYLEELQDEVKIEVELNEHLLKLVRQLHQTSTIPVLPASNGFRGELRHYQSLGMSWLQFLGKYGLGACLADDMGLGKTVQYIAYLLGVHRTAETIPSLLICPTSVIGNWQKEIARFAPDLRVYVHYGSGRTQADEFATTVGGADVVLTSYTLAHLDEETLTSVTWQSICLDEAQNIKNVYTKQTASIRKLNGLHRIAMTGTPIENRLTELWSIFDFLNPGYLGSLKSFTERFVIPIEKTNDATLTEQVQRLIRPFLLRRVKTDPAVELDLPDKTEMKEYVSLTTEQAALYESVLQQMLKQLDELDGMQRRGLILATLLKLKQICDHPALYLKETEKARVSQADRSTKLTRLLEMVRELRAEGDKCLIFTQFVELGKMLQHVLAAELDEEVLFLHGGVKKELRDEMVTRFQDDTSKNGRGPNIFVLSLKAGGVGLNLTAANHVFHYDRWWNPAVENQATDRAYRIGQAQHVQVHKFVALGTLEERIDEMLEKKQSLSQQIVGGGESWITELSTDDLREMFALRREWIES